MDKILVEDIKKIPTPMLLLGLKHMVRELKRDPIIIDLFKEYNLDINEIDFIPMTFTDLDVSARCDHGIIYFNYKLLENGSFEPCYAYATHEITHWAQQTANDKPTQSSDDGNYLDNEYEQEGFQNQISYISEHFGEDKAEDYVDHLLDHHDVKDKSKKDELESILLEKV